MQKSETINELATALAKAQGQIQDAKKDSSNPFFKSHYADLASIWAACRKPLSDNGLSVVQTIEVKEGKRILESILFHSSGQWISSSLDLLAKEETEQALGSAITYTRRYALSALVGISPDDDDAEAAMARPFGNQLPASARSEKPQPVASEATPASDSPQSAKLPASQKEVFFKLMALVKSEAMTQVDAAKVVVDLGGTGENIFQKIKSLKPDKLQELNKKLDGLVSPED